MKNKFDKRLERKKRIRRRLKSLTKRGLRLSISRSNREIYAQIIDDKLGKTLVAFSSLNLKKEEKKNKTKKDISFLVGEKLAERAMAKKIEEVYFDRGGYKFHGRIKALAEGARKGGLKF